MIASRPRQPPSRCGHSEGFGNASARPSAEFASGAPAAHVKVTDSQCRSACPLLVHGVPFGAEVASYQRFVDPGGSGQQVRSW